MNTMAKNIVEKIINKLLTKFPLSRYIMCCEFSHPTACVSRKWAGHGQGSKTESCRGVENCPKTRRLPLVGCTLCWALLCHKPTQPLPHGTCPDSSHLPVQQLELGLQPEASFLSLIPFGVYHPEWNRDASK